MYINKDKITSSEIENIRVNNGESESVLERKWERERVREGVYSLSIFNYWGKHGPLEGSFISELSERWKGYQDHPKAQSYDPIYILGQINVSYLTDLTHLLSTWF